MSPGATTGSESYGSLIAGPILIFRGVDEVSGTYYVAALVVVKHGHCPRVSLPAFPMVSVRPWLVITEPSKKHARQLWCYEWSTPMYNQSFSVNYVVSGCSMNFSYVVPARGLSPRCCFTSCNGFHEEQERMKFAGREGANWKTIVKIHEQRPFHLLLMGGDQIYADAIFKRVKHLKVISAPRPLCTLSGSMKN